MAEIMKGWKPVGYTKNGKYISLEKKKKKRDLKSTIDSRMDKIEKAYGSK